jgi:hypothetical protein
MSESELTELKNFQNGFLAGFGFYSVNSKILQILIQTIKEFFLVPKFHLGMPFAQRSVASQKELITIVFDERSTLR